MVTDQICKFVPRVSASEYLEETLDEPSWTIEETVKLGGILAAHGVDLYDLSAGGNHPAQKIAFGPLQLKGHAYQAHFSDAVRKVHGVDGSETKKTGGKPALLVGAVGGLRNGQAASEVLESGQGGYRVCRKAVPEGPGDGVDVR